MTDEQQAKPARDDAVLVWDDLDEALLELVIDEVKSWDSERNAWLVDAEGLDAYIRWSDSDGMWRDIAAPTDASLSGDDEEDDDEADSELE